MRILNKIILSLVAFGSIAAMVLCAKYDANMGEYGYPALAILGGLSIVLLMVAPLLNLFNKLFDFSLVDGKVTIKEEKKPNKKK